MKGTYNIAVGIVTALQGARVTDWVCVPGGGGEMFSCFVLQSTQTDRGANLVSSSVDTEGFFFAKLNSRSLKLTTRI